MMARREKAAKPAKATKTTPAQGSSWTHGRQMGGKVLSAVLFAAIACGPIALFAATARPAPVVAAAPETRDAGLSTQQQTAGGYAAGVVASGLRAPKDEPGDRATPRQPAAWKGG